MQQEPYFAIFISDDNDLLYFQTLNQALHELNTQKQGIVMLFYLQSSGQITENGSEWWTWDHHKQKIINNKIINTST
jgi:hypothetical protein